MCFNPIARASSRQSSAFLGDFRKFELVLRKTKDFEKCVVYDQPHKFITIPDEHEINAEVTKTVCTLPVEETLQSVQAHKLEEIYKEVYRF